LEENLKTTDSFEMTVEEKIKSLDKINKKHKHLFPLIMNRKIGLQVKK